MSIAKEILDDVAHIFDVKLLDAFTIVMEENTFSMKYEFRIKFKDKLIGMISIDMNTIVDEGEVSNKKVCADIGSVFYQMIERILLARSEELKEDKPLIQPVRKLN